MWKLSRKFRLWSRRTCYSIGLKWCLIPFWSHRICRCTSAVYLLSSVCAPHTLFHTLYSHHTCNLWTGSAHTAAVCNAQNQFHKIAEESDCAVFFKWRQNSLFSRPQQDFYHLTGSRCLTAKQTAKLIWPVNRLEQSGPKICWEISLEWF